MQDLKTLIDKASKVCGNDAALAKRMGIAPQTISNLRTSRTITPETAAELAGIAGEDAIDAVITAMLDRAKGTRREGVLREILGKALAAGVAGMLVFFYSSDSNATSNQTMKVNAPVNFLYIVEHCKRLLASVLRSLGTWLNDRLTWGLLDKKGFADAFSKTEFCDQVVTVGAKSQDRFLVSVATSPPRDYRTLSTWT